MVPMRRTVTACERGREGEAITLQTKIRAPGCVLGGWSVGETCRSGSSGLASGQNIPEPRCYHEISKRRWESCWGASRAHRPPAERTRVKPGRLPDSAQQPSSASLKGSAEHAKLWPWVCPPIKKDLQAYDVV